jgi:glutathione S-transferase
MSMIVIHGIPGSPFVRMPIMVCHEKGVPWRLQAMGFGEQKSPEHLKRQPFGQIPAIEHGEFQLYETQAIVRYIDAAFEGTRLTPADPKRMARMSQVMNILDWYVTPSLTGGVGFNRIVKPIIGMPVDEAAVEAALPLTRTALTALADILGDNPYFAGDALSLADLTAIAHLDLAPQVPEVAEMLRGSPLPAWIDRMNARESVRSTTMGKMMGVPEPA